MLPPLQTQILHHHFDTLEPRYVFAKWAFSHQHFLGFLSVFSCRTSFGKHRMSISSVDLTRRNWRPSRTSWKDIRYVCMVLGAHAEREQKGNFGSGFKLCYRMCNFFLFSFFFLGGGGVSRVSGKFLLLFFFPLYTCRALKWIRPMWRHILYIPARLHRMVCDMCARAHGVLLFDYRFVCWWDVGRKLLVDNDTQVALRLTRLTG